MRTIAMIAGLALAVGFAPTASNAACSKRTTGTVLGAVTGGLLGHAVAGRGDHTEGTLIGAGVGGLVGNQVTKCRHASRAYYAPRRAAAPRRAYPASASYPSTASCRYEQRAYYDHYGRLVSAPVRVCGS
jgi:uncharacterized protein YcfJ